MVPCVSFPTELYLPMSFVPMFFFSFQNVFTHGPYNMFLNLPQVSSWFEFLSHCIEFVHSSFHFTQPNCFDLFVSDFSCKL